MPAQSTRNSSESTVGSHSPTAPPYSPITPDPSQATLASLSSEPEDSPYETPQGSSAMESVSESDNIDMIALRSTIAILQQQRDQGIRDMRTLERQKNEALADPQAFVRKIATGQLQTRKFRELLQEGDVESTSLLVNGTKGSNKNVTGSKNSRQREYIPGPQNVVRVPPIEWAKYHIVGEALNKLHVEQQRHPGSRGPQGGGDYTRGPEIIIAAPYRPLTDGPPGSSKRMKISDEAGDSTENA